MALPAEADRLDGGWQEVYSALQWIQFTMAMLSVVGSSSIIAYAVFQNAVRSPEPREWDFQRIHGAIPGEVRNGGNWHIVG